MPDISMCLNDQCSVRRICRRHEDSGTTPTPKRQSYTAFPGGDDCSGFWRAFEHTREE